MFKLLATAVALSASTVMASDFTCTQHFPNGKPPEVDGTSGPTRALCFSDFAALYAPAFKTSVYAVQKVDASTIKAAHDVPRQGNFYADARLPAAERATPADYKGSGFDRGHLVPAATMPTPEGMAQSFSMVNIVPQNSQFNRGPWKQVEKAVFNHAKRSNDPLYVYTGPVYLSENVETIGNGVAVPTHIFKAVVNPATGKSHGWIMPNEAGNRMEKPIPIEQLENIVGINFTP